MGAREGRSEGDLQESLEASPRELRSISARRAGQITASSNEVTLNAITVANVPNSGLGITVICPESDPKVGPNLGFPI